MKSLLDKLKDAKLPVISVKGDRMKHLLNGVARPSFQIQCPK